MSTSIRFHVPKGHRTSQPREAPEAAPRPRQRASTRVKEARAQLCGVPSPRHCSPNAPLQRQHGRKKRPAFAQAACRAPRTRHEPSSHVLSPRKLKHMTSSALLLVKTGRCLFLASVTFSHMLMSATVAISTVTEKMDGKPVVPLTRLLRNTRKRTLPGQRHVTSAGPAHKGFSPSGHGPRVQLSPEGSAPNGCVPFCLARRRGAVRT